MAHAEAHAAPDGVDLGALSRFLDAEVDGGLTGALSAALVAGGRSNPTYELFDDTRHWILRRPPLGEVMRSTHDMMRENRVVSALHGSAVPVANIVAASDGTDVLGVPFYVMDKIDGRTFRTAEDTATLSPMQRAGLSAALVDLMVDLHAVVPAEVGLGDFGRPDGYLTRQLSRWSRQWEAVKTREAPEVAELARRLGAALPELHHPGIVHGDFKIDNVMVSRSDPARILALLDWEMATLGDTLADLGQLISFWDEAAGLHNPITAGATAHPGFWTAEEVVGAYGERRGIDLAALDWYIVFADFKLAVILEQIHARHLAGNTIGDWFDDLGAMVEPVLARALDRARASRDPRLAT